MPAHRKINDKAHFSRNWMDPINTREDMADYFGVGESTITNTAKRFGLPLRRDGGKGPHKGHSNRKQPRGDQ